MKIFLLYLIYIYKFNCMFQFLTSYINSHYTGMYLAINKILYIIDEDETSKIEMTYCDRIKTAVLYYIQFVLIDNLFYIFICIQDINYITDIPKINIENMDSKISFTNHVYKPPPKVPCKLILKVLYIMLYKNLSCTILFLNTVCIIYLIFTLVNSYFLYLHKYSSIVIIVL